MSCEKTVFNHICERVENDPAAWFSYWWRFGRNGNSLTTMISKNEFEKLVDERAQWAEPLGLEFRFVIDMAKSVESQVTPEEFRTHSLQQFFKTATIEFVNKFVALKTRLQIEWFLAGVCKASLVSDSFEPFEFLIRKFLSRDEQRALPSLDQSTLILRDWHVKILQEKQAQIKQDIKKLKQKKREKKREAKRIQQDLESVTQSRNVFRAITTAPRLTTVIPVDSDSVVSFGRREESAEQVPGLSFETGFKFGDPENTFSRTQGTIKFRNGGVLLENEKSRVTNTMWVVDGKILDCGELTLEKIPEKVFLCEREFRAVFEIRFE